LSAAVSLAGIVKRHGSVTALAGIDLEVAPGEFFSLLGPSGSGKTTTLRILAGLERADAGSVRMNGRDITSLDPGERDVAMVFQSYALYPHMTVAQNIAFPLKMIATPPARIAEAVRAAAGKVGIAHLLDRRPGQLSGGQQQRVALARAIVRQPRLFLLDEPLSNLDAKLRVDTRMELKKLQRSLGVTTVYVTHDQEEAMTLSTRIGVMNHGEIVQVGTPSEIYEYPNSRFVTEFIGSVNMFEGRLIEDEPAYVRIQCDEFEAPIYVDHGVSAAPGATVWAAIRPEKVHLGREQPTSPDNWAVGVVSDIAYMGDLSVYLLRLDSGKVVRVTQPNTYRHAEDRITWDERIYLSWHASSPVVVTK
jgi:putrescine transport system ATP-binding protein